MKILKNLFLFNKKTENNEALSKQVFDHYIEIAKLVKEARIQQNLSIQDLSRISKIPEQTIYSIENNNEKMRPQYPFLRSILIKLEICLEIKENTLVKLAIKETFEKEKKDFIVNKFDILDTWQGSLLYFLILISTIFVLKKYFIFNVNVIEIQNIENETIENSLK